MLRLAQVTPLVQILAVLVENLDAHVPSISYVNTAVSIDVDLVHRIVLTIPDAWGSPLHQELPVLVELHHARVGIAVADKERPVWQPRNILGRPKCFSSVPATPGSPSLITSCLPSWVNLKICCRMSSITQTCRSGSYGLILTLCGPRPPWNR